MSTIMGEGDVAALERFSFGDGAELARMLPWFEEFEIATLVADWNVATARQMSLCP